MCKALEMSPGDISSLSRYDLSPLLNLFGDLFAPSDLPRRYFLSLVVNLYESRRISLTSAQHITDAARMEGIFGNLCFFRVLLELSYGPTSNLI